MKKHHEIQKVIMSRDGKRDQILQAATDVFSKYSYHKASLRMIAKQAGVDHPHLFYYFSNKADLFETVLKEQTDQYTQTMPSWFEGIKELNMIDALSTYFDRAIYFHLNQSQLLRITFLNMAQSVRKIYSLPGFEYMKKVNSFGFMMLQSSSRVNIPDDKKSIITTGFGQILTSLIGAREFHAEVQGLDPNKEEYSKWVKKVMISMMLPFLMSLDKK